MLRRLWSLAIFEVGLARVTIGFILGYSIICFALILILVITVLFAPHSLGLQISNDLGAILLFTAIGFPIGFVALNGPIVAFGLFLASVWFLVVKRLNFLVLLCCFVIASFGIFGIDILISADLSPKDASSYSGIGRVLTLFLEAFPLIVAIVYVWFDPRYRKRHEL